MKDDELIKLIKKDRTEGPIKFLYKEFPKIKALIMSSGGSEADARQIFHDSLILLIEKVQKQDFVLSSKLSTFLYGINRFLWMNALRKKQKNVELEWKDTLIVAADDIDYAEEKEEKLKALEAVLNRISEQCKTIFELFYFKKQSMDFIAKQLKYKSVNSAKTQKYKCMEKAIKLASQIKVFILFILCTSQMPVKAQLSVDTSFTLPYLVDSVIAGNGIRIGNIKLKGHKVGLGYFETDSAVIGMHQGVLLATGSVFDAVGENDTPGKSGILRNYKTNTHKYRKRGKGDRDLNRVCKGRTKDVNCIEFDFVPFDNKVSLNFCFGSEEYKDYVGSKYNDAFAFFVYGPGIRKKNMALIPGTDIPVSINTVNHKKHKQYFINNDYFINYGLTKSGTNYPTITLFQYIRLLFSKKKKGNGKFLIKEGEKEKLNQVLVNHFQYDGFTKVFKIEFNAVPYKKYHFKIVIGDVGDEIFDSGVFIEAGSFTSIMDSTMAGYKPYEYLGLNFNFDSLFGIKMPKSTMIDLQNTPEMVDDFVDVDVYYDRNAFTISDSAKHDLDELVIYLSEYEHYNCVLQAYTDHTGSKSYNQKLSEKRAKLIISYLVEKGIDENRISYGGHDFTTEDESEGGIWSRRIEILIIENTVGE